MMNKFMNMHMINIINDEIHSDFEKETSITMRMFFEKFYDDLILLTGSNKQRVLNVLEYYANETGFFKRIREHIEYLESKNKKE